LRNFKSQKSNGFNSLLITKSRLCPPFTPQEAAQFYRCLMLLDTLELAARV
jgi:hypothetical protein